MTFNSFKAWGVDAGVRAVKTAAQTAVALLGADVAQLVHADWATVGITAGLAGAVSILHNLATLDPEDPFSLPAEGPSINDGALPMEESN